MRMSLEDEIRKTAKEMIENLSKVVLFKKTPKERFQDILSELNEEGEIIRFLPNLGDKRFGDFAVVVENKGKQDPIGVAIKEREGEIKRYMERQNQLRKQIGKYRKFIERFVFAVNPGKTNEDLKKQWAEALKQYQES